jgi:hypothetical protein
LIRFSNGLQSDVTSTTTYGTVSIDFDADGRLLVSVLGAIVPQVNMSGCWRRGVWKRCALGWPRRKVVVEIKAEAMPTGWCTLARSASERNSLNSFASASG